MKKLKGDCLHGHSLLPDGSKVADPAREKQSHFFGIIPDPKAGFLTFFHASADRSKTLQSHFIPKNCPKPPLFAQKAQRLYCPDPKKIITLFCTNSQAQGWNPWKKCFFNQILCIISWFLPKNSRFLCWNPLTLLKNPQFLCWNPQTLRKNPQFLGRNPQTLHKSESTLLKNPQLLGRNCLIQPNNWSSQPWTRQFLGFSWLVLCRNCRIQPKNWPSQPWIRSFLGFSWLVLCRNCLIQGWNGLVLCRNWAKEWGIGLG